jgi:hypothetical protein
MRRRLGDVVPVAFEDEDEGGAQVNPVICHLSCAL